jgi:hypothetical protein
MNDTRVETKMPHREPDETPTTAVPLQYTRNTPVRPTIWMTGVLVWATVIAFLFQVPVWAGIFLCSLTGLSFLLYLVSYIYLMATDRDALRREKYSVVESPGRQLVRLKEASLDSAGSQPPTVGLATQPLGDQVAILSKERRVKEVRAQDADIGEA